MDLDKLTPEEYRARYEGLQAAARALAAAPPAVPPVPVIDEAAVVKRQSVPAGAYVYWRVKRGDALRVVNSSGTPGVAVFLWNADDVSERYNAGDTVKLQWTTRFAVGRVLFSDMGRVLASITADSGAGHDSILGANGPAQSLRNGRENLRLAAQKFGMTRRDVGPCLSLFVELRAEMNLLVALSNTPHVLSPVKEATGAVELCLYHAAADDFAKNFSAEARRGFENTDEVFA
jgi:uncharacterized protein YcgI (DUF1989 family)